MTTVLRMPLTLRTWREGLHALLNFPVALAGFLVAVVGLAVSGALLFLVVGLPLLTLMLLLIRLYARFERARARVFLRLEVAEPEPLRLRPGQRGPLAWMGAVLRSNVSWRSTAYALLHVWWAMFTFTTVTVLWAFGLFGLTFPLWGWTITRYSDEPGIGVNVDGEGGGWIWDSPWEYALVAVVGALIMVAAAPLIRGLAAVDRLLVSTLLGRSEAADRMLQLEADRSVVVDASAADLRRIERDLHDGAQARLVALAMELGMAKETIAHDPETAARLVNEAHGEVKQALQELRDLARGIHPAILTDRGLGPALSAVASRCTVPVAVDVDLPLRPAEAIEGIAYYTASELLQNVSKHSGARRASVDVWRAGDRLMLQVTDDGQGGADPTAGTGLAGLADRLGAVDGLLAVHSPAGGPTTVTAELPWRGRAAAGAPAR
ncbi:sensor histidine kinase [Streptomyces sp. 8K308]|uniref:sensor histidine kinase n=1 Tax=Streptomyces sp. 8K308 TaxID=2530388 RepID=UPI0010455C4A|nr:sensor domain-containing protein [Streptomyces sp. 8K308]TDC24110.1 sensor histidine kinase [Streptomyces sp. 8K308]